MDLKRDLLRDFGRRCREFSPGCPVCDIWEMYDLHAYGAIRTELAELDAFMGGLSVEEMLDQYICEEVAPPTS